MGQMNGPSSLGCCAWPIASPTRPAPTCASTRDNPVDWYPWGDEAFARARAEDKPILLSIGYSACHWCHVMEHESFEDEATAARHERALRQRQGRPRGAARRRRDLHGRGPGHDRARRLADDRVPDARRASRSTAAPTSRRSAATACRRFAELLPRRRRARGRDDRERDRSTRPGRLTEALADSSELAPGSADLPGDRDRSTMPSHALRRRTTTRRGAASAARPSSPRR